jgi:SAM-dependent methyltransferase
MNSPRRLVFGQVADLYDRSRPTYPDRLIDELVALAPLGDGRRALEVGAGTGRATRLMAARDVAVLAIEPSAEMAAVVRRTTAGAPSVEVVQSDFETWRGDGERFGLVYSAQAWHWIDPAHGYVQARGALVDDGLLAAFWNRPVWADSPLREALSAVYRRLAPEMPSSNPYHPDNAMADEDWDAQRARAAGFGATDHRRYDWSLDYSADGYVDLLATLSLFRLLAGDVREGLLAGIRATIEEHGGAVTMPMATLAFLARAV